MKILRYLTSIGWRGANVPDEYEMTKDEKQTGASLRDAPKDGVQPEADGGWIQTVNGNVFYPLAPHQIDVDIDDIAHALAMKCRYSGHTAKFYSVAEHSVHISNQLLLDGNGPDVALYGLIHDASEAYLPDVARPIKHRLAGFAEIEAKVQREIVCAVGAFYVPKWRKFEGEPAVVKEYDTLILRDEKDALLPHNPKEWGIPAEGLGVSIQGWDPTEAKVRFLRAFHNLSDMIGRP